MLNYQRVKHIQTDIEHTGKPIVPKRTPRSFQAASDNASWCNYLDRQKFHDICRFGLLHVEAVLTVPRQDWTLQKKLDQAFPHHVIVPLNLGSKFHVMSYHSVTQVAMIDALDINGLPIWSSQAEIIMWAFYVSI